VRARAGAAGRERVASSSDCAAQGAVEQPAEQNKSDEENELEVVLEEIAPENLIVWSETAAGELIEI